MRRLHRPSTAINRAQVWAKGQDNDEAPARNNASPGRIESARQFLSVSVETACAIFHKALPRKRPPRGVLSRKELQVDEHPLIGFAEGSAGQRARLLGTGKDVWEVIAAVRDNGGDPAETARYLEMPLRLVRAAIAYYGTHSDEIDQWIDLNAGEAAEAHAAFAAEQATSPR